jgi:hypothetical protein
MRMGALKLARGVVATVRQSLCSHLVTTGVFPGVLHVMHPKHSRPLTVGGTEDVMFNSMHFTWTVSAGNVFGLEQQGGSSSTRCWRHGVFSMHDFSRSST